MFDDPNKELQWLQDELLAAEDDDNFYDDLDDLLRDYDETPEEDEDDELADLLKDYDEYEEEPAPRSRRAPAKQEPKKAEKKPSRFGGKKAPVREAYEEELDDSAVFYREDYKKAKKNEKRGNRGLLIIIVLELVAIVAILARWLTWLI